MLLPLRLQGYCGARCTHRLAKQDEEVVSRYTNQAQEIIFCVCVAVSQLLVCTVVFKRPWDLEILTDKIVPSPDYNANYYIESTHRNISIKWQWELRRWSLVRLFSCIRTSLLTQDYEGNQLITPHCRRFIGILRIISWRVGPPRGGKEGFSPGPKFVERFYPCKYEHRVRLKKRAQIWCR